MKPIPFSIELWQQGYRTVTRDGRKVTGLAFETFSNDVYGHIGGNTWKYYRWSPNGRVYGKVETGYDLFLLPPEDEIVVEVRKVKHMENEIIFSMELNKVPPGKYILKPVKNN